MNSITKLAAAVALCVIASPSFGQSVSVNNTTALINTNHTSTITFTRGGAPVEGIEFEMTYVNAELGLPVSASPHPNVTPSVGGFSCAVSTLGRLRCVGAPAAPVPETITFAVQFAVGGTEVPAPGSPLVIENVILIDGDANPIAATSSNGSVTIITAPPNVTLSYAPAAGSTITFPSGTALTTQNASITVTGNGTVGSGTVTGCTITGSGAGAFGAPPADITVAAGATGTLPLTCTLPNSGGAATATLTCTETDSDTPAPGAARTWNLSCPQGTPVPGPGYSSSPAPGSTLNCDGTPGGSTTTSFTVTNNGNPGAGSELTFTCTAAGAGFSIVSGGSTTAPGLAIGASQTVVVGCTPPAEGAPAATGTVSCTTNAGATPSYNLSSTGVVVPPPVARPAIVPATSYWSQALLVLLLAGLGMAFVGFRRS